MTLLTLLAAGQGAWAQSVEHIAFSETFDTNNGSGGRDGLYSGNNVATSNPQFDRDGWTNNEYIKGARECIRFGTSEQDGVLTTPEIIMLGKQATLTFYAAGWSSGSNRLDITANEGVTLNGQTTIMLGNSSNGPFEYYQVDITLTTATYVQLTFTGKRGFLDDVMVEETVTAINAPTLPDEYIFWPNTTETPTTSITLTPSDSTTVYYTTDGTDPSATNGTAATQPSSILLTGTTTVKARAYYKTIASDLVSRTYSVGETVNGIAAFRQLADGNEVRLYLDPADDARVLHTADGKTYLRDLTAPLCLDLGAVQAFNPQHNQQVTGWIVGKKQTTDGLVKLVATDNTSCHYLTCSVPSATAVAPQVISASEINNHVGDWVLIEKLHNGSSGISVGSIYNGALVDVSCIVTANDAITPVDYDGIGPVVYVFDEEEAFESPSLEIENVSARLNRTLWKDGSWNTLCLPFGISSLSGTPLEGAAIYELSTSGTSLDLASGTLTLAFSPASGITAGRPYLVKWSGTSGTISNPVFTDVTISSQGPTDICSEDGYVKFAGQYSPFVIDSENRDAILFMKSNDQIGYSQSDRTLPAFGAHFWVQPGASGQGAQTVNPDFGNGSNVLSGHLNGGVYWATFYNQNVRFTLTEGAAAYTMDKDHHLYRLGDDGRTIPAGTAVIIISDKESITLTPDTGTNTVADNAPGGNLLQGSDSPVTVSGLGDTPYVLGVVNGILGFHPYTGTEIPANKAYYVTTL